MDKNPDQLKSMENNYKARKEQFSDKARNHSAYFNYKIDQCFGRKVLSEFNDEEAQKEKIEMDELIINNEDTRDLHKDKINQIYQQQISAMDRQVAKRRDDLNKIKREHDYLEKQLSRHEKHINNDAGQLTTYYNILAPASRSQPQTINKSSKNGISLISANEILSNHLNHARDIKNKKDETYKKIFSPEILNKAPEQKMNKLIKTLNYSEVAAANDRIAYYFNFKNKIIFSEAVNIFTNQSATLAENSWKSCQSMIEQATARGLTKKSVNNLKALQYDADMLSLQASYLKSELMKEYQSFTENHPREDFQLSDQNREKIDRLKTLERNIKQRIALVKKAQNAKGFMSKNSKTANDHLSFQAQRPLYLIKHEMDSLDQCLTELQDKVNNLSESEIDDNEKDLIRKNICMLYAMHVHRLKSLFSSQSTLDIDFVTQQLNTLRSEIGKLNQEINSYKMTNGNASADPQYGRLINQQVLTNRFGDNKDIHYTYTTGKSLTHGQISTKLNHSSAGVTSKQHHHSKPINDDCHSSKHDKRSNNSNTSGYSLNKTKAIVVNNLSNHSALDDIATAHHIPGVTNQVIIAAK